MWLDAFLAYLHYAAIFLLVGFMAAELTLSRLTMDLSNVRRLGKVDIAVFLSAMTALVTGGLRLVWGAKGPDFYLNSWPFYVKVGIFFAIAAISVKPTLRFIHWRRMLEKGEGWSVPEAERRSVRRILVLEMHLAAMMPVFAVVMSRGLGN